MLFKPGLIYISTIVTLFASKIQAEPIQFKSDRVIDTGQVWSVMVWLVVLLSVASLLVYLLKKHKTFSRFKSVDYEHVDVKTTQFMAAGLKIHRIRYYQNEYLLVEKSNSLIQLDLSRGKRIDNEQQEDQ
jgi:hypothetical protein